MSSLHFLDKVLVIYYSILINISPLPLFLISLLSEKGHLYSISVCVPNSYFGPIHKRKGTLRLETLTLTYSRILGPLQHNRTGWDPDENRREGVD